VIGPAITGDVKGKEGLVGGVVITEQGRWGGAGAPIESREGGEVVVVEFIGVACMGLKTGSMFLNITH